MADRSAGTVGSHASRQQNAVCQMTRMPMEEVPDEERDHTPATNLSATFHLCPGTGRRHRLAGRETSRQLPDGASHLSRTESAS
ncbi:hypothetical protein RVR_10550 [Actinacidiphila reveromycinica]|uniref:Uncharacterized protein n=1 Tax=Actinacidiphila reveromycinica TaxID=659352 RepID=A0A7U3V099_9ACTN|nr:hypothetical protein RVR_10550 [Streptomyces sp. SN-593]